MGVLRTLGCLLLQAIAVAGQQSYEDTYSPDAPSLFHYHGCAEVDLTGFGDPITFSDGTLAHEACQAACEGHSIAALFPDSCRCGDDTGAFSSLDSSACDYPCMGDPAYGMCGSQCPTKGPGISTIYITSDVLTTQAEDDPPDPELSPPLVVVTTEPSPSEAPTVILQTVSAPPEAPTGPPADPSVVLSESTNPPNTTTRSASRSATSVPESEITLFPTVNTTVSRTSSSTSEDPTPNVERDDGDPPSPSQVLQSDVEYTQGQPLLFLSALALVIAAAV